MGGRKYTHDQITAACEMREAGASTVTICRTLGMTKGALDYQLKRNGADAPTPRPHKLYGPGNFPTHMRQGKLIRAFTADEDRRLIEGQASGIGAWPLARELGRSGSSVRNRFLILARYEARAELEAA